MTSLHRGVGLVCMLFGLSLMSALMVSCQNSGTVQPRAEMMNTLSVSIEPIDAGLLLPGGYFSVRGSGFLEGASFEVTLILGGTEYRLESRLTPLGGLDQLISRSTERGDPCEGEPA